MGEPEAGVKFPVPSPSRIVTVLLRLSATARSSFPSPLQQRKHPPSRPPSQPRSEEVYERVNRRQMSKKPENLPTTSAVPRRLIFGRNLALSFIFHGGAVYTSSASTPQAKSLTLAANYNSPPGHLPRQYSLHQPLQFDVFQAEGLRKIRYQQIPELSLPMTQVFIARIIDG
jgi:hypothetical protein